MKYVVTYYAEDANISITNLEHLSNKAVTCVYKHVVEVTRTGEDVTQIMEEDNTVEELTQVVDSDCNLTDDENQVY